MHAITGDHVLWAIAYSWGPTVLSHTHIHAHGRGLVGGKGAFSDLLQRAIWVNRGLEWAIEDHSLAHDPYDFMRPGALCMHVHRAHTWPYTDPLGH